MVTITVENFAQDLNLQIIIPGRGAIEVETSDQNRPGLQFSGFFLHFANSRIQVIGNAEIFYLMQLDEDVIRQRMQDFMSYELPAIIVAQGMQPPEAMRAMAEKAGVPLFVYPGATTKLTHQLKSYLDEKLAPSITRHGGLMDIFGIGIMLAGESGIGKSETALELIQRGHALIADDVIDIRRVSENRLVGSCPEVVRFLMEIRGIGIIDVRHMYGVGAVMLEKSIDLVINLEMWQQGKNYDRIGAQEEHISILGVPLPVLTTPVRPGRNLAIIAEVAARNFRLRRIGYDAAKEFDKRWMLATGEDPET